MSYHSLTFQHLCPAELEHLQQADRARLDAESLDKRGFAGAARIARIREQLHRDFARIEAAEVSK